MDHSPPLSVAVVEDDDAVRRALCRLLRSAGLHADSYASGEELLAAVAIHPPACVLLDIRLPGMDGLEVLSSLQRSGITLPVIIISAALDPAVCERAMTCGAVACLPKPVDQRMLLDAITEALAKTLFGTL